MSVTTKEFTVRLSAPEWDADKLNTTLVADLLTNHETHDRHGLSWVDVISVNKYDPESNQVLSKIGAIKRIRTIMEGTSLRDAKFLVDTAERLGEAQWSNVTVTRMDTAGTQFRVIDNR